MGSTSRPGQAAARIPTVAAALCCALALVLLIWATGGGGGGDSGGGGQRPSVRLARRWGSAQRDDPASSAASASAAVDILAGALAPTPAPMSDLLSTLPAAELRRAVKLRQALQCLTAPLASGLLTNQKLVQVDARLTIPDNPNATAKMFVYGGGDIVSGWVASKQGWEHGELAELFWAMQRGRAAAGDVGGPLFVDIGANIGHFTVHMAKAGYRVVSFEGTPDNIGLLQSTLCANPDFAPRVTLYPTGLSYYNTSCEIFTDPNNQGNGLTVCKEDTRKRDFVTRSSYIKRGVMELRRLDDLMLETDVVSALKIDTEGHELNIIKGGAQLLKRGGVRYVMMEILKDLMGDDQTKELLSTLAGHGFRISPKSFKGPWLTEAEIAAASVAHGSNIFCAHNSTFSAIN